MRHHEWVSRIGHSGSPTFTLGWTQFTIVLIVIAAVLLLTGVRLKADTTMGRGRDLGPPEGGHYNQRGGQ